MPTAYIAQQAIDLPVRFTEGQELSEFEALLLNKEYIKRLAAQVRYRIDQGHVHEFNIMEVSHALADSFLFSELNDNDPPDDNDPVYIEGIRIAKDMIMAQLADTGVTEIPNIETHALALYRASPEIQEQARHRLETRWRVAQSMVGN
jgi:hypothetical protein